MPVTVIAERIGRERGLTISPTPAGAVRSHPGAPGGPGALTACGPDTAAMVVDRWSPQRPGQGWYPPRWAGYLCPTCDAGARAF